MFRAFVIINKDEALTGTVAVSLPGYSHAAISRLTAPAYTATSGVVFAGQTLDGSTDGKLLGTPAEESVEGEGGVINITMPITSAALIVFAP